MTVIAIDGPAAAGKGTLARRLARHLGFAYLDTGALYRAVGLTLLRRGIDPRDAPRAAEIAADLDIALIDDPEIRSEAAGEAASQVAALPAVRQALLAFQRDFATRHAGAVLDGRDIGTVVCPQADIKLFVTADLATRARRRWAELEGRDEAVSLEAVTADLVARDARDAARAAAPLKPAADAHLLDTTNSDIDSVFKAALALINKRISRGPEA